jgi:uncharacterized membrane protein
VRVDFWVIREEESDAYSIEFKFENESLVHSLNKTMRTNMFQVSFNLSYQMQQWIDRVLEKKHKIK